MKRPEDLGGHGLDPEVLDLQREIDGELDLIDGSGAVSETLYSGSVGSKYTDPVQPLEYVARSEGVAPWVPPMQVNQEYVQTSGITGDPELIRKLGLVREDLSHEGARFSGHPMDMVPSHVEFPGIL